MSGSGGWGVGAVQVDTDGATYYAGSFSAGNGTEIGFGCSNSLYNEETSLDDAYVVKVDDQGSCIWQKSWGYDQPDADYAQKEYSAVDLTLVPSEDRIVLALKVRVTTESGSTAYPAIGSKIVELDASSGQQVWSDELRPYKTERYSYERIITGIDINDSGLVASGTYNFPFDFGPDTLPYPGTNYERQAMTLKWSEFDGTERLRLWGEGFGGKGWTHSEDIAIGPDGDVANVGFYPDEHVHLDGTAAPTAMSPNGITNLYIQTHDPDGSPSSAYGSRTPGQEFIQKATDVDFNAGGEMFVAGDFHGQLVESRTTDPLLDDMLANTGSSNFPTPEADYSQYDYDHFLIRFDGADNFLGKESWYNFSNMNRGNQNSPEIEVEQIRDLTAGNDYVAIAGRAAPPETQTGEWHGFAHMYDFSSFDPGKTSPEDFTGQSEYTKPYVRASGESFVGTAVDFSDDLLTVGGFNGETNYSLGGPTLPGGYGFFVGYTY